MWLKMTPFPPVRCSVAIEAEGELKHVFVKYVTVGKLDATV